MNPIPPSSAKWIMQGALECCYMSTKLHGVTSKKTVILTINAERTLNINLFIYIYQNVWPVAGRVYIFGCSGILPKLVGEGEGGRKTSINKVLIKQLRLCVLCLTKQCLN